MKNKFLKKYVPDQIWRLIKLAKAMPTYLLYQRSQAVRAYLPVDEIDKLQHIFLPVSDYPYDELSCRKRGEIRAMFIAGLAKKINAKSILELGCADAMTSVALKNKAYNAWALDLKDQRLESAKNSALHFIEASAENIPIGDAELDVVFSYNAMEHFTDPARVIDEVFRILKKGGLFYADFDPLYYSPRGLHAYRQFNIPYIQFLFALDDLEKYAVQNQKNWLDIPYVNGYSLDQYRLLWRHQLHRFQIIKYREELDLSGLALIRRYPGIFHQQNIDFINFITSGIRICLRKK